MNAINEKFNIDIHLQDYADVLSKYIAGVIFLNEKIELPIKIKKYILDGKRQLQLEKTSHKIDRGYSNYKFSDKNKELPDCYLQIVELQNPLMTCSANIIVKTKAIEITINKTAIIKNLDEAVSDINESLMHEMRHYVQLSKNIGFAKKKVKTKGYDIFGLNKNRTHQLTHQLMDIEFKPNVHTYAYYIKKYLSKYSTKKQWKDEFKNMLLNPSEEKHGVFSYRLERLAAVRSKDPTRWKQYVKEIYQLVFI